MSDTKDNWQAEIDAILPSSPYAAERVKSIVTRRMEQEKLEADRLARIDEIDRMAKSTGEKKPKETWEAWSWRVVHYLQDRIAALKKGES